MSLAGFCLWCREPLEVGDETAVPIPYVGEDAVPTIRFLHSECHIRMTIGSEAHQNGTCACYGEAPDDPPPGVSLREDALAAVKAWEARRARASD